LQISGGGYLAIGVQDPYNLAANGMIEGNDEGFSYSLGTMLINNSIITLKNMNDPGASPIAYLPPLQSIVYTQTIESQDEKNSSQIGSGLVLGAMQTLSQLQGAISSAQQAAIIGENDLSNSKSMGLQLQSGGKSLINNLRF
jgi:hypothetical protein